jgi:lipopolysaccharide biosynthesis glycosyltransferase
VNILVTTDKNYLPYAYVMLVSLLENNGTSHINLYYIHYDIDDASIEKFNRFFSKYDMTVTFLKCDFKRVEGLKTFLYVTPASYLRIISPDILPETVSRILYLDPDIIVAKSLTDLYDTDLGDCFFGAVEDLDSGNERYEPLNIPGEYGYFNTGVMLIDLDKFRSHRVSGQVIDYALAYPNRIQWADQDALNAVLYDKRLALHPRWNLQTLVASRYENRSHASHVEFLEAVSQPAVIHYVGGLKPWQPSYDHPLKGLYWHYIRKTPYKYSGSLKYWGKYIIWKPKNIAGFLIRESVLRLPKRMQNALPRALIRRLRIAPTERS